MVPSEITLNALWFGIAIIAAAATIAAARSRRSTPERKRLEVVCVALVVAALFPYISATDDAVRVQHFYSHEQHRDGRKTGHSDNLIFLYEVMDAPIPVAVHTFILTFFLISLVYLPNDRGLDRSSPLSTGRSPPFLCPIPV